MGFLVANQAEPIFMILKKKINAPEFDRDQSIIGELKSQGMEFGLIKISHKGEKYLVDLN